jgi:hypothetical protein
LQRKKNEDECRKIKRQTPDNFKTNRPELQQITSETEVGDMEDDWSVSGVREWDGLGSVIDSWTGYQ